MSIKAGFPIPFIAAWIRSTTARHISRARIIVAVFITPPIFPKIARPITVWHIFRPRVHERWLSCQSAIEAVGKPSVSSWICSGLRLTRSGIVENTQKREEKDGCTIEAYCRFIFIAQSFFCVTQRNFRDGIRQRKLTKGSVSASTHIVRG